MTPCPTCRGPGGIALFTSVAPCEKCAAPVAPGPRFSAIVYGTAGELLGATIFELGGIRSVVFEATRQGTIHYMDIFERGSHQFRYFVPGRLVTCVGFHMSVPLAPHIIEWFQERI